MKKRHKHEKKSKKSLLLVNIILFLACIIAGAILFFTLKESHSILSAEKTEQISKKSDQQTSTTPSTEQTSVNQANDNNSEVNWVQQDSDVSLPILMYHAIHVMAPEEASNANLIVDPTTFESHIKRLSDEGYYFLTPEEAYKVLTENVLPNGNSKIIWLTFDDSLWDFYDNAYPILKKYKAKATNNVITSTVGNSANLSLDQMLEMKGQGMSFQSHTSTHPDLSASDDNTQKTEMSDAKSYLDNNLSQDTITIAYPAGRYSDTTLQLAGELNYKLGITTNEGIADKNDGLLSLDRIRILPETTADSLMASINQ
ncbi:polysaccharide deacetylase family protein [Streptococcus sp. SL1232]|uniref:polysaccharide deacetylase family protein n=1 Tax=Streptococcus vicugnae TaxID=2740579 RepID=UPI0018F458AE|nr:polysaccharide deacetylase family protein [Streptococcus vicugnae]MBJ7540854.1 polysaccharide deacetylase family protein [Streptococcus vicugnae]